MFKFIKQLFKFVMTVLKVVSFLSAVYLLLDERKQERIKDKLATIADDLQDKADAIGETVQQQ